MELQRIEMANVKDKSKNPEVLPLPKYVQIQSNQVKLLGTVASDGDERTGIFEIYTAILFNVEGANSQTKVWVKQFFKEASYDYTQERDSTLRLLSIKGISDLYVEIYGYNDQKLWIIMKAYDCTLHQAMTEKHFDNEDLTIQSNRKPIRMMVDVARYLKTLKEGLNEQEEKCKANGYKMYPTVVLHRDIIGYNIFLPLGWTSTLKNDIGTQTDNPNEIIPDRFNRLKQICRIGFFGCQTTRSQTFKSGSKGDLYKAPPDYVLDSNDYDWRADSWRFGILAFEMCLLVPWNKFTLDDQDRMVIGRLKPRENNDMQNVYNDKWMAQPDCGGALAPYYEVVQVGCFQVDCKRRPPPEVLLEVMKWCLWDTYIERKMLPPRDSKFPKSNDAELVIELCGFKLFPPPPGKLLSMPKIQPSYGGFGLQPSYGGFGLQPSQKPDPKSAKPHGKWQPGDETSLHSQPSPSPVSKKVEMEDSDSQPGMDKLPIPKMY